MENLKNQKIEKSKIRNEKYNFLKIENLNMF